MQHNFVFIYVFILLLFFSVINISLEFVNSFPVLFENTQSENLPEKPLKESDVSTTTESVSRYNRQLDSSVESRFRINPNTIIRTGESRILGARYINETILPSNHDCLTWCLETPNCNAAVYEEKDAQSCYMFNCGGPSASLCKFTSHSFFISSVLKVTQHSYDLSQWGNQIKHEQELAELRKSDDINHSSTPKSVEQKNLVTTEISPTYTKLAPTENPCHHYQFKCYNSSECIAIYNVCDGIPQCPDGSDESVDMKCHEKESKIIPHKTERPVENKVPKANPHISENRGLNTNLGPKVAQTTSISRNNPQNSHVPQLPNNSKLQGSRDESRHMVENKNIWANKPPENPIPRKEFYHHTEDRVNAESDGLGSPFIHKHSQFVAANDPHTQNMNRWSGDYDQYPQHSMSMDQQYSPYDNNNYQRMEDQYASNQLSPDYDTVKGYGGYRQEDIPYWTNQDATFPVDEFPQAPIHSLNKQNNYPDKDSMYAQQLARTAEQYPEIKHRIIHKPPEVIPETPQQNRASDIEKYKQHRISLQRQQPYLTYDEPLQKQPYPSLKAKNYQPHNIDDSMYNSDDLIRASIVNQLPMEIDHPHHPYQYEMKHTEEIPKPHTQENAKEIHDKKELPKDSLIIVKSTPHPKSVQKTVLDFKMSVTELYQSSRTHSQEANSAILALVMGLTITFLLFIFLACRVKTIRKRMSRKGRALAHDADYLVNGMYL